MHGAHEMFLKHEIPSVHIRKTSLCAYTDTCAQTCISDTEILSRMNLNEEHLLPTCHGIIGVTGRRLDIVGAIMVELQYNQRKSRNVVYVCKNVKGFFLPKKVQVELGMLHSSYPGGNLSENSMVAVTKEGKLNELN